jgi:hypothetical protein
VKRVKSEQVAQYTRPGVRARLLTLPRGPMLPARAHTTLIGALVTAVALICVTNASALSGTPINIGAAGWVGNAPAVAVGANGTAYIAWPNANDGTGENETIQYCTLPAGASKCEYSQTLTPVTLSGYTSSVYGANVQVLLDGTTVVLLADTGEQAEDLGPVQEWTSTDGGATFNVVNEGHSVADNPYLDHGPFSGTADLDSGVLLPGAGTGALGVAWTDASGTIGETPGKPEFSEFPFSPPVECSTKLCSGSSEAQSLQPASTYPAAGDGLPAVFASQSTSNPAANIAPGVLGVFSTNPEISNATCPGSGLASFGTAFVYGEGAQSATNSYGISPGQSHTAWKVPYSPGDCGAELPAVGGGPSGFGVVEENTETDSVIYHSFDQQSKSFDTPKVTIAPGDAELFASVSQDGSGGIYTTYEGLGSTLDAEGIRLAYSANGGQSWMGPATLDADPEVGALVSSVGTDGQGWASWHQEGSIYAQQFDSSDATPAISATPISAPAKTPVITPPVPANGTVSFTATVDANGTSVTLTFAVTCKSTSPCVITITVTANGESGSLSFTASAKHKTTKHHPKTVTVATGTLTLTPGATRKVTLHLTKAGKKLLAAKHGHLTTKVELKDTSAGHTTKSSSNLSINTKTKKKKTKK